jgi:hypothetical protein
VTIRAVNQKGRPATGGLLLKGNVMDFLLSLPARAARALILLYRVTFSAFAGRSCRYAPTCSEYAGDAIAKHGLWAGGWMGFARVCRCRPGGGEGFDPVPETLPPGGGALTPWRYARWRGPFRCDTVEAPASRRGARGEPPSP